MKPLAFSSFLLASALSVVAQDAKKPSGRELDISYYSTHIGSNISAEYNQNFGKHTVLIGIKCHLNHYIKPSANGINAEAFYKQFEARTVSDYMGASLGYEYHLKDINPYVSPYVLLNVQYARMPTKHLWMSELLPGSKPNIVYSGPFTVIESVVGLGLSVKLTKWMSLNQSLGGGVPFITDSPARRGRRWINDGIFFQWRVGLAFKLG